NPNQLTEAEVILAELIEMLDDAIGLSTAHPDVGLAERGPVGGLGEIESSVADLAEAEGLTGGGLAGDGSVHLTAAEPFAQLEVLIHIQKAEPAQICAGSILKQRS